jgi:hypothetical protein
MGGSGSASSPLPFLLAVTSTVTCNRRKTHKPVDFNLCLDLFCFCFLLVCSWSSPSDLVAVVRGR